MQYAKPVTLNVEECDRLSFLPYLFGLDFLYAEASVYAPAWPASLPAGVSLPGVFARADRRPPPPAPVSPVSAAL
jgi:hypothetical protein